MRYIFLLNARDALEEGLREADQNMLNGLRADGFSEDDSRVQAIIREANQRSLQAARRCAQQRVRGLFLTKAQRRELGRYRIGLPDEGNVMDKEN